MSGSRLRSRSRGSSGVFTVPIPPPTGNSSTYQAPSATSSSSSTSAIYAHAPETNPYSHGPTPVRRQPHPSELIDRSPSPSKGYPPPMAPPPQQQQKERGAWTHVRWSPKLGARQSWVRRIAIAYGLWLALLSYYRYASVVYSVDRMTDELVSPLLKSARRPMWVIAHPDDECLFFSPTLNNLILEAPPEPSDDARRNPAPQRGAVGHILVLSVGGYEGLGGVRKSEMMASCMSFGISPANCVILDHPELPDSPDVWWPEKTVEDLVRLYIAKFGIDLIITFDDEGISGHTNHRAINSALSRAVHTDTAFPPVFKLTSVSIPSKYSLFLTFSSSLSSIARSRSSPLPALPRVTPDEQYDASRALPSIAQGLANPAATHASILVNSPAQYRNARGAFARHKSQARWFRSLWCLSSRYMWWNVLERIVPVENRVVHVRKGGEHDQLKREEVKQE